MTFKNFNVLIFQKKCNQKHACNQYTLNAITNNLFRRIKAEKDSLEKVDTNDTNPVQRKITATDAARRENAKIDKELHRNCAAMEWLKAAQLALERFLLVTRAFTSKAIFILKTCFLLSK